MSSLLVYNAPSDMVTARPVSSILITESSQDHELGDRYATCQDSLKVICDEIKGLRDMWESLSPVWLEINGLENSKLSDAGSFATFMVYAECVQIISNLL